MVWLLLFGMLSKVILLAHLLPLTCRACCGAAYKKSQSVSDVRFMFDGSRVNPEQTPQELGMEDEDSIDAFIEQVNI